jgi:hypothetical protein
MNPKKMETIREVMNSFEVDKSRIRNHFRNVCFRKKFSTIKDHIKYIAKYYGVDEVFVISSVENDLKIIKKQTGLN